MVRKPRLSVVCSTERICSLLAVVLLVSALPDALDAQAPLERLRVYGGADADLFEVKSAAFRGARLLALTAPTPALHAFGEGGAAQWGKEGDGPEELRNPGDVAWKGDTVLVHDLRGASGKVVAYDPRGRFIEAYSTRSCGMTTRMQVGGGAVFLSVVEGAGDAGTLVHLRGDRCVALVRYTRPNQVRLEAPGSPSLTLTSPFAPTVVWTALPNGQMAVWNGRGQHLDVYRAEGGVASRIPLPQGRYPVDRRDREWWIATEIPADFMGQKVFEPLREKAREEVRFPEALPPVLGLLADPAGGVWVQRTTEGSGQVWTWVDARGEITTVRLPPARRLLAVGDSEMAVLARDELDVERIEVYRKPRPRRAPTE